MAEPKTKADWLAKAEEYRNEAEKYKDYPHDSWEYSQYQYYMNAAATAEYLASTYDSTPASSVNRIGNYTNGVEVKGTDNADYIHNNASNVTINGGAGNDSIRIDSYASEDNPTNVNVNVKIFGGNDNDFIQNYGADKSVIDGGAGDDIIDNWGKNLTISGGTGDDSIKLDRDGAVNAVIEYSSGDGNDTVAGFGATTTLKIGDGTGSYSTQRNGSDIIVTVGEGKITLGGAASLSKVNIQGSLSGGGFDTSSGGDSLGLWYYHSVSNTLISGTSGKDTICSEGNNVTIYGGAGDDSIYSYGNEIKIFGEAGNDIISVAANEQTIDGGEGNDTILATDWEYSITGGKGNDLISLLSGSEKNVLQYTSGDGNDTIFGLSESDTLKINGGSYSTAVSGSDVVVTVGEGNMYLIGATNLEVINIQDSLSGSNFITGIKSGDSIRNTLAGAMVLTFGGNDTIINSSIASNVSINSGDGDDWIQNWRAEFVTINAGVGNDTIRNENKYCDYVSINAGDGDDFIENFRGNNVTIDSGTGNDTIDNFGNSNVLFIYGGGNDSIDGFNVNSTLSISGSSYSTKKNGDDVIVTVDEGKITLAGAADLETVNINFTKTAWTINGTTAKYGTADKTLAAVDGVKSLDGISLKKKVVTVSDASLNKKKVTISDGYTLKLGKDVTKPATSKAWSLNKSTATYKQTTTAGYTLNDNTINYSDKSVEALATVKGVKSLDGISLKKKVVTISDASLNKKKVTVSDGYTLKLGKDVTKPATSKTWSLNKSTATYKQTTTAGYNLSDNAINYSKKSVETLATVKGVKSLDGISLKKKVVTVSDASLNKKKVTVSDGYTLKLGKDVNKPATSKTWSLNKSTATYKQTTTAGYTLNDNAINYSDKSFETLATIKGVKSLEGLKVSGKTITLKNSALKSKVTVGGGYEFDFAKDYKEATISGSADDDSITTRGKKLSINAGEGNDSIKIFGSATVTGGKGNDSLWGSSYADNFIYSAGDGNDVIYGFDDKDTLTLDNLDFKASYKNDALTLKITDGSIMLKDFTATTFHINDSAYKINGSKLVRK